MEFLTLLIALGLVQLWGSGGPIQQDDWYEQWQKNVANYVESPAFNLAITVFMPCFLVILLQDMFESLLFGLLSLVLYVGVLLFSLGRGDFSDYIQKYLYAWSEGDSEAAYEKATAIGDFHQEDDIIDHETLHDHVRKAIVYEGFERWFAVVFWFLLIGPVACLGYRLCYLSARMSSNTFEGKRLALQIIYYLDWIPARLLAISFTLTGNFVNCFNRCWQIGLDSLPTAELLDRCAVAALSGIHEHHQNPIKKEHFIEYSRTEIVALQSLLSRSVICWLIIVAILQLT